MRYRKSTAAGQGDDRADSVIAAFEDALAGAGDQAEVLRAWIARYPALAADLSMAAGGFHDMASVGDEAPIYRGRAAGDSFASLVDEVLMAQPVSVVSFDSPAALPANLADASRHAGIAYPHQLAVRLRVPDSFLRHLHRGDIDSRTIPSTFAQELAELIKLTFADTVQLLRGPSPASGALVLEAKAQYGGTQSFEAILALEAEPDDRDYWVDRSRFATMLGESSPSRFSAPSLPETGRDVQGS